VLKGDRHKSGAASPAPAPVGSIFQPPALVQAAITERAGAIKDAWLMDSVALMPYLFKEVLRNE